MPVDLETVRLFLHVLAATICGQQAYAHHAFAAEFDGKAPVLLKGKVTKVEWINPHAWVHVNVVGPSGTQEWMVEGGTPNTLLRAGLTKDGARGRVDIVAFPAQADACKPECRALVRRMTFADGRAVFLGAAGPALPPTNSDKDAALARGDWRLAAGLGATAAEIVSALQAKGQAKDIVPNEAVVVIPPVDGSSPVRRARSQRSPSAS